MDDQLFGRVGEVGDDSIASDFNVRVDDGRGSLLTENVDQTVLKEELVTSLHVRVGKGKVTFGGVTYVPAWISQMQMRLSQPALIWKQWHSDA